MTLITKRILRFFSAVDIRAALDPAWSSQNQLTEYTCKHTDDGSKERRKDEEKRRRDSGPTHEILESSGQHYKKNRTDTRHPPTSAIL